MAAKTKRLKGETRAQCVRRKIGLNIRKFKSRKQAVAVSMSQCR